MFLFYTCVIQFLENVVKSIQKEGGGEEETVCGGEGKAGVLWEDAREGVGRAREGVQDLNLSRG